MSMKNVRRKRGGIYTMYYIEANGACTAGCMTRLGRDAVPYT